jgi:hypothetical protein
VLPLALLEQALQPAEEVMLLELPDTAARRRTAGRLAAAVASIAGRLRAAVAGSAGRLCTTIAGSAAGLTSARTAVAGSAIGLTARGAALVAEHLVQKLEPEGLATNGDTKNQRTEKHHTLHRATSPLLADHARVDVPFARLVTPRL